MKVGDKIIRVAIVLSLVTAACGDSGDAGEPASQPPTAVEQASASTTAAPTTVAESTTSSSTSSTLSPDPFSTVTSTIEAFVAERGLNGAAFVLVDADDGVVYEQYWGELNAERISLVASSSKMVSSGVLLSLQEQGVLDINTPIAQQLDWTGDPTMTVAQMLSNSSGLVGLGPNVGYGPYLCQFLINKSLQECGRTIYETPLDDADVVPPDTEFRYGGGQWQVAGAVAETLSGKSWAQLIDEIYVQPCQLKGFGYNNPYTQFEGMAEGYPESFDGNLGLMAANDNPSIEGGLYTTVPDYAKVLLMHLQGGRCGDNQVLSQASLDTLHNDRTAATYNSPETYGMGWFIDGDIHVNPGLYGSVAFLRLADGYGGFLVLESTDVNGNELAAQLLEPVSEAMSTR